MEIGLISIYLGHTDLFCEAENTESLSHTYF